MRDVVFLLIAIGFFAIAAGYVRGCARLVGETPGMDANADEPAEPSGVAA